MTNITQNIKYVRQQLVKSAQNVHRDADKITLLAVSKTQSPEKIREAWEAGISRFGENYLQEALHKIADLKDLDIEWHFIGPVQSNKTRAIAEHFHWVHTVDRVKIAERLSNQRPASLPPLNICIQVNIDSDPNKSGVLPEQLPDLVKKITLYPGITLRGLMTIPKSTKNNAFQYQSFFRLAQLLDTLRTQSPELQILDTLSMGMSADMDPAIKAGSTLIRVGTAIFGSRNNSQDPGSNRLKAQPKHLQEKK